MALDEWQEVLLREAKKIVITGGRLELIIYKRDNKRKPVIRIYPDNERSLKEIELID